MAVSKYRYVKGFEQPDNLLPHTYIVLRVDGRGFHKFSKAHDFAKPNDSRALDLMDQAAQVVMANYPDIVLSFGQSDEYSFLFRRNTSLYSRRASKILSTVVSLFTSAYLMNWSRYFGTALPKENHPPSFDGRITLYPTEKEVRDYFAWRQVDTHINNLYNTTFWALVQNNAKKPEEAHAILKGSTSAQKQEILFSQFRLNYNDVDARFRKGTTILRRQADPEDVSKATDSTKISVLHCDIVSDTFWSEHFANFEMS